MEHCNHFLYHYSVTFIVLETIDDQASQNEYIETLDELCVSFDIMQCGVFQFYMCYAEKVCGTL